jgi:hypothetical protein
LYVPSTKKAKKQSSEEKRLANHECTISLYGQFLSIHPW